MPIKTTKIIEPINETTVFNEEFKPSDNENSKTIALLDKKNVDDFPTGNILINNKDQKIEISNENYNILNLTIIFIISFVAIIILLDTFKYPISKIVPDIELILYNLYETINDIKLFLIDLI
jgi:hypothetical protein